MYRALDPSGRGAPWWRCGGGLAGLVLAAALAACDPPGGGGTGPDTSAAYETRPKSEHGTGRFYMGREIAEVLGSPALDWMERPGRETEELPNRVIRALELEPADVVADIGAGSGYFTFRISPNVPEGKVYAVDIDPEMLGILRARMAEVGLTNIETVRGTPMDPNLPPDAIDVALIVFSYPQFSHPREMMQHLYDALKPGGRAVLVEYRGEDPTIPVEPIFKITQEQARKELEAIGFKWRETRDILPQQHFMVFEKPVA
jgi:ubiquinone/menaquinone biosynthesis C-methylase UbiE